MSRSLSRSVFAAFFIAGLLLCGVGSGTSALAQNGASAPKATLSFEGVHPALAITVGVVAGITAASVIGGGFTVMTSLVEGLSLTESLEAGTGLPLPAIAASGILGGLLAYILPSQDF